MLTDNGRYTFRPTRIDEDDEGELMVLNFGPQHPSTHGVFRIELHLDGEVIVRAIPHMGYLHRGVEKLCEKLTWVQLTPIVDKNDYISPMTNEQAIVMAVEKLLKIEVPRRARYMRSLLAELQRIQSHLLALGTYAIDLGGALGGGTTTFMYCFRERDRILDLFEEITGARFHYNTHTVGGQRHDLPAGWDKRAKDALATIESVLPEIEAMTLGSRIFVERSRGVGVLDANLALSLGITGPNLRASGVPHDLRVDAPYAAYDEVVPNVITATEGDCLARITMRVREASESIRLARLLIDGMPEGPICGWRPVKNAIGVKIPSGQTYVAVETPRGELGTYAIAGGTGTSPYRLKIRPPSLHAVSALPYLLPGHAVSDTVAILGSLDPIMGEVDR